MDKDDGAGQRREIKEERKMFDLYKDFYTGRIPYLKLENRFFGGYSAERIVLKNGNLSSYFDAYSKPVEECIVRYRKRNDGQTYDPDVLNMRVILVSNDVNLVRKSAMCLADGVETGTYDEEDDFGYDDEDMDSHSDIVEIELGRDLADERVAGNPYIIKTQTVLAGAEEFKAGGVLFRGLETGNLADQCAAISSVHKQNVFVGISAAMVGVPEIQRLVLERGFDMVRLPDVDSAYYKKISDELINYGGVPFESDALKETVIGSVIKKCGRHISEEQISRALSEARLKMDSGDEVFRACHFPEYINTASYNAYEKLSKMTGLNNLKAAVNEYIAVKKEARNNPKAEPECRHKIFEGNPGGGKTMGAEIFSEIMAAEGISNGTFVVASRKDIIGEYVGHTAPKVEKLFRDASGGVLFVDEAGFFLDEASGGFVKEAIKEFVRYMELCRDVTVIFAMYPGEAKRFLGLDQGLSSRISSTVRFDDYSEKELAAIFKGMLEDKGYVVHAAISKSAGKFLMKLKAEKNGRFGNAREARKLADMVVMAVSLRHEKESAEKWDGCIKNSDLREAIKKMEKETATSRTVDYGFSNYKPAGRCANAF